MNKFSFLKISGKNIMLIIVKNLEKQSFSHNHLMTHIITIFTLAFGNGAIRLQQNKGAVKVKILLLLILLHYKDIPSFNIGGTFIFVITI